MHRIKKELQELIRLKDKYEATFAYAGSIPTHREVKREIDRLSDIETQDPLGR